MKHFFTFPALISIFLLSHICSSAQTVSADRVMIDFGNVFSQETDSEKLVLQNLSNHTVKLTGLRIYDIAFTTDDTAFMIPANGSHTLTLYFSPKQNIKYNSALLLLFENNNGNIALDLGGQGKFKEAYYNSTENFSEEDLKAALKKLLAQNYNSLGYNTARDKMYMEIDNKKTNGQGATVNTLECVYTGRQAVGYASRSDAQTNYDFNTEHTFPQGFFDSNEPMKSDLHHLFPTDNTANGKRSNDPFGKVSNASWQEGGSKSNGSLFEPRDVHKGDVARALFYFVIRYQDYENHVKGQEETLRSWLFADTVDAAERHRNEAIFKYQKNRNPFVDHPEFAMRIHSFTSVYNTPADYSFSSPVSKIGLFEVAENQTISYLIPLAATGNRAITVENLRFSNASYQATKSSDTLLAGESGYLQFNYHSALPVSPNADTIYFTVLQPTPKEIKIPVLVNSIKSGLANEINPDTELKIFPNPTQNLLYITLPENASKEVEIYNMLGEKMLQSNCTDCAINTSVLSKGVYVVKIKAGEKVYVRRVVKQ